MSTILAQPVPFLFRWLRVVVEILLPRSLRDEYLASFDRYRDRSMLYQIEHALKLVCGAYFVLALPALTACGPYMPFAELVLIVYCFGMAAASRGFSWRILIPLGTMMSALSLRDIWWHPGRTKIRRQVPPIQEYYLQSAADALCALVFLFLGQGLAWYFAWAVAVRAPVLFRAASLCLAVLPMLRLILRPMPDPQSPFEGQEMSAVEMYHATCWLNFLWTFMFSATVLLGTSDIPNYWPDFLRGFLPLFTLCLFLCLQRDGLERNIIQRLLVSPEERALAGAGRFLARALRPGEAFYVAAKVLKLFIFSGLALEVEATIRPWLMGSNADFFFVAGNIIGLVVCVLTFRHVWQANQVTVQAVHEERQRLRHCSGGL